MKRTTANHHLGRGQSFLYPYRINHHLEHLYLYSSLLLDLAFRFALILGLFFLPRMDLGFTLGSSGGGLADLQNSRYRVAT